MNVYTFHVEHSYSVLQTYDPSLPWNQNPLLQEQKLSGIEKKAMLQCDEQVYQIQIPFIEKLIVD
jgi:hypothetical protein